LNSKAFGFDTWLCEYNLKKWNLFCILQKSLFQSIKKAFLMYFVSEQFRSFCCLTLSFSRSVISSANVKSLIRSLICRCSIVELLNTRYDRMDSFFHPPYGKCSQKSSILCHTHAFWLQVSGHFYSHTTKLIYSR
jgi:hypothetical protein